MTSHWAVLTRDGRCSSGQSHYRNTWEKKKLKNISVAPSLLLHQVHGLVPVYFDLRDKDIAALFARRHGCVVSERNLKRISKSYAGEALCFFSIRFREPEQPEVLGFFFFRVPLRAPYTADIFKSFQNESAGVEPASF